MELNWSTFVLEILNFVVLVWILKRFLYRPVLKVIADRRAAIEKTLADAEARHADADVLRERYEGRLNAWEAEREKTRAAFAQELERERAQRLTELQHEVERLREKARVVDAQRVADTARKLEETALAQGARFAARLLEGAAGPDTQARLIDLALDQLRQLPEDRLQSLRGGLGPAPVSGIVVTAYPLPDDRCRRLAETLDAAFNAQLSLRFDVDPALLAGARITLGAWELGVNVRDELKGFAELSHAR